MGALQNVVVCRQHQSGGQGALGFRLRPRVHLPQIGDTGDLEVVAAALLFGGQVHVAVGVALVPGDGSEMIEVVEGDQDPFESVGDLNRHRVEHDSPGLLEVGELGDLLPIEPDFPPQSPGAQCRGLPVVLDESDVMQRRVNPQMEQRLQVDLLRVAGIGFENHLELVVLLQAIGVLSIARIIGTDRRLDIGYAPRLRPQHPQVGCRVHRPGPHLGVVGLPDHAPLVGPEALQIHDYVLKRASHPVPILLCAGFSPAGAPGAGRPARSAGVRADD